MSSFDLEDALNLEERGAVLSDKLDMDVVVEGRGDAWDIKAEVGSPVLSDGTSGQGAVTVVVGSTLSRSNAVVGHVIGDGTHKEAGEVNCSERGLRDDVPDTTNVELEGRLLDDLKGISVGLVGEDEEFVLARDLVDDDIVFIVRGGGLDVVHFGAGSKLGGGEGSDGCSESSLEHFN